MARKGAMAKNPPLRGAARKEFRAAQREAVASGGSMPTQAQFRPRQQPTQRPQPTGNQPSQSLEQIAQQLAITNGGQAGQSIGQIAGQVADQAAGQMPPDKMMRYPQLAGQSGAVLNSVMGDMAGSRSEGMRNPFEPRNDSYWFQGKPNMPGYAEPNAQGQMPQGIQNGLGNFAQMPQPSANNGGKYRLSPGVYGTKEQAMQQWAMQQAVPMQRKG